jgi:type I restriction-modification system DNA methylase subunit
MPIFPMLDDIKKTLWATADKLRANMDAAEYKHLVLGLIFLKYVSDTFAARRAELTRRFADANDDYFLHDCDAELLADELEDRDYYKEVNVFWVPESARWEALRAAAKQTDIGKRIDDALAAIEGENSKLKGILDKRYARAQLPDGKLGELVDLVSAIGFGTAFSSNPGQARDVLGQVYEYFLGQFASAEGKKGGQFYTPASIVKTLVAVLAPHHGKVYDPCWVHGTPPQGNANYAWLQHMLYHLKANGRAGIVLANGSMSSSQNSEGDIRRAMVEADVVEVMVALPGQLFFNTQIPACLWFLVKQKPVRKGQVLFIDARKLGTMISRVQAELGDEVIERIAATVAAWRGETGAGEYQDIPGYCRSVPLAEIAQHGHVLTPGRYVGAEAVEEDDEAFAEKMLQLTEKLGEQMARGAELDALIRQKLGGVGYEF